MTYILSGFRTPKPGKAKDLINASVDFYKSNNLAGMVTVNSEMPSVNTHRLVADADSIESLHDAFELGTIPGQETLAGLESLTTSGTRYIIRERIAPLGADFAPNDNPKYMLRIILDAKVGLGPELLDVVLSNHERLGGPVNVTAKAGSLQRIILYRPLAHFSDVTKARDGNQAIAGMKQQGMVSWNHLCESVERRVGRIAYMKRST